MENLKLVSGYRENEQLRESFNHLAKKTFQIDFSKWFNKGYWTDKYVPFSFTNNDGDVIANASIFKMSIVIENVPYIAIQIGTVMTDVRYRNKGLANILMSEILNSQKNNCDFIYLFANASVIEFYPRFGFSRVDESEYSLMVNNSHLKVSIKNDLKKLSVDSDLSLLETIAKNRYLNKSKIIVKNNEELLMFYFLVVFPESIYYISELETIILMEHEGRSLHIFDIISPKEQVIDTVLSKLIDEKTEKIVFHFEPNNLKGLHVEKVQTDDDALFYLSKGPVLEGDFKFPITSHC
ncbi:GNAT family N-acetyltransferase [Bacillus sp. NPDC077027]|uniref:GNAT family N-acetyltransferase n=1 Tax=Bacillus sp. NPDC077027 TaxID=3390548 RepID=UPI003D008EEB